MKRAEREIDLFVVGGGINGAAVARDAVGRGLTVMLAEARDYAGATSSASSKLIHGGLRYLEHYRFAMVRESLKEREIILKIAPHLAFPLRFLLPITRNQERPAWMVWLGLKLYDVLSGRRLLASSGALSPEQVSRLPRLRNDDLTCVLHYPDCWVDDARLVLETLLDARARGADIANRREVLKIQPADSGYYVQYRQGRSRHIVHARFVVNAAGPWANEIVEDTSDNLPQRRLRLVRGSHIVLKMPGPPEQCAYTLQNADGRVVCTIPWQNAAFLVIGTTDAPHDGDPARPECTAAERDYLLESYNRYFDHPGGRASANDVVWTWAGVRVLPDDGKTDPARITRSARILVKRRGNGGFITLYGGKLTTHRRLAEKTLQKLGQMRARLGPRWTANAPLHGGRYDREKLTRLAAGGPKELPRDLRLRWAFTYGDEIENLFAAVRTDRRLAKAVAPGVLQAELRHSAEIEDAQTAEDFLTRRTKLHLFLTQRDRAKIEEWFAQINP